MMAPQAPGKALDDFIEAHRRDSDMLLRRMKWDTATDQLEGLSEIKIDCYAFEFQPELSGPVQYPFLEFMETLDLANEQAIVKICIWLLQAGISFRLRFGWNWQLPWSECIKRLFRPGRIYRSVMKNRDACLKHDLSADPRALRPATEGG